MTWLQTVHSHTAAKAWEYRIFSSSSLWCWRWTPPPFLLLKKKVQHRHFKVLIQSQKCKNKNTPQSINSFIFIPFPTIKITNVHSLLHWFSSVQSLSLARLFATPWTAAHQAFLSITNSQSLLKLMSIESVMPSSHLILCRPLLLLPSIFPSIRVFSKESVLCILCLLYWQVGP